jgi:hypothetical protein
MTDFGDSFLLGMPTNAMRREAYRIILRALADDDMAVRAGMWEALFEAFCVTGSAWGQLQLAKINVRVRTYHKNSAAIMAFYEKYGDTHD